MEKYRRYPMALYGNSYQLLTKSKLATQRAAQDSFQEKQKIKLNA